LRLSRRSALGAASLAALGMALGARDAQAAGTTWTLGDSTGTLSTGGGGTVLNLPSGSAWACRCSGGTGRSTGLWYYEINCSNVALGQMNLSLGFANASETLVLMEQLGGSKNSSGYYPQFNGDFFVNNAVAVTYGSEGTPSFLIGLALNFNAKLAWVTTPKFRGAGNYWNNATLAAQNPAGNVGGISLAANNAGPFFVAAGCDNTAHSGTLTLATGSNGVALALAVPSGYLPWDGAKGGGLATTGAGG